MKKSELISIIRKIIRESTSDRDLGAFHQDLQSQVRGVANSIKRSDYAKGDEVFTITGSPVTFISDTISDRKTGEQRVIIRTKDGATMSTKLAHILPEMPSKEQFLSFIAGAYNSYTDFVNAAMKRGYDENDGIKDYWTKRGKS